MAPAITETDDMVRLRGEKEVPLTPETIDSYLEHLRSAGRIQGTLDSYRRKIWRLYRALPEDGKVIRQGTLPWWREELAVEGRSAEGINQFVIAVNGYLEYMGAREFQVREKLKSTKVLQPELTRGEYLRLLSAARALRREQAYLLVKVFGNSALPAQELPRLTVETVQAGKMSIHYSYSKEIVRFPDPICRELLDYAGRRGIHSGPIFRTRSGKAMDRTNAAQYIRRLCAAAQVPEEKGNPRCLRKMYQSTREGIERNIALLVEKTQDRLLEEEQLVIGWDP